MQVLALGVFVVYTGDRLMEHGRLWGRTAWGLWGSVVIAAAWIAVRLAIAPALWSAVTALGALSLSYVALKRFAVLKTCMVGLTWTIGAAVLAQAPQPGWQALGNPAALALLLTVCAGAVLCDLKDAERDRMASVHSLPVMVGERRALLVAAALALVGAALAASIQAWALMACAVAMMVLAGLPNVLRRPVTGPLVVDAALALPGALLFAWS